MHRYILLLFFVSQTAFSDSYVCQLSVEGSTKIETSIKLDDLVLPVCTLEGLECLGGDFENSYRIFESGDKKFLTSVKIEEIPDLAGVKKLRSLGFALHEAEGEQNTLLKTLALSQNGQEIIGAIGTSESLDLTLTARCELAQDKNEDAKSCYALKNGKSIAKVGAKDTAKYEVDEVCVVGDLGKVGIRLMTISFLSEGEEAVSFEGVLSVRSAKSAVFSLNQGGPRLSRFYGVLAEGKLVSLQLEEDGDQQPVLSKE